MALTAAGSAMAGGMLAGPAGAAAGLLTNLAATNIKGVVSDAENLLTTGEKTVGAIRTCIKETENQSLPKEISNLRTIFGEILSEAKVRLVVLVDDLDRCLPETMISTLEAMRLLLFVDRTIFVIAADEFAIKNAVRIRYGADYDKKDLIGSYFDKLIQIPVRVPHPSHNEIRCYLTALFAETACLKNRIKEETLVAGCNGMAKRLSSAWLGRITTKEIDDAFGGDVSKVIRNEIDLAEQMVSIASTSTPLSGNPRLIKRFVNAAVIRRTVAESQGVECPLDALIKLMLLERCLKKELFEKIHRQVLASDDGVSEIIRGWESFDKEPLTQGDNQVDSKWVEEWASIGPRLSDMDLRPLMYLSRDVGNWHYSACEELSSHGREILKSLLEIDSFSTVIKDRIQKKISNDEALLILRKLMAKVKDKKDKASLLISSLAIPEAVPQLRSEYIVYLDNLGTSCFDGALVPHLSTWEEAVDYLRKIKNDPNVEDRIKRAIKVKERV